MLVGSKDRAAKFAESRGQKDNDANFEDHFRFPAACSTARAGLAPKASCCLEDLVFDHTAWGCGACGFQEGHSGSSP
jgi:hypothetical protein